MTYAIPVKPGSRVDLSEIPTDENGGMKKKEGEQLLLDLTTELNELQDLLYAASDQSVLIIFQGMDTSGKDGTIKSVFRAVDPLGCRVWSFKVPTELESKHDFLWRAHDKVPEIGMMTLFNRSYYEDVVVVRVRELAPVEVWRGRYEHINNFERMLTDSNTIVLKFFLHVSRVEQRERLLKRELKITKAWKLSTGDWAERQRWDEYTKAYEDALTKCSTKQAPWFIVPADRKWYRDLAVADTIVKTLRPLKDGWTESLTELGKQQLGELEEYRRRGGER